ncbi:MAG: TRAP transporter small permease [Geminicoccaceae bacterium]
MTEFFSGLSDLLAALFANDAFMLNEALSGPPGYAAGVTLMILGIPLTIGLFRAVPVLDRNLERWIVIASYLVITAIIFVEVIRRFVFQLQAPWSTTLPPYLFLVMTWFGAAYNAKLRSHLSFDEVRMRMPPAGRFACVTLDTVLWLGLSLIVVTTTLRQTTNSASNFQILLGTDDVMQWWFYAAVPVSWLLLSTRVVENFMDDVRAYRTGEPIGVGASLQTKE